MALAFHHFFVFVDRGAPVVDFLVQEGFSEGSKNSHPGQGTANRRLFFENGMLEFIWAEDLGELRSPATAKTRLWERSASQSSGFSPFGVCLCPSSESAPAEEPFEGWAYTPAYLPSGLCIWEAHQDAYPWEPMLFSLSFAKPYSLTHPAAEPLEHANGAKEISWIRIGMKKGGATQSTALAELRRITTFELYSSASPGAEIIIKSHKPRVLDLTRWCPLKIVLET